MQTSYVNNKIQTFFEFHFASFLDLFSNSLSQNFQNLQTPSVWAVRSVFCWVVLCWHNGLCWALELLNSWMTCFCVPPDFPTFIRIPPNVQSHYVKVNKIWFNCRACNMMMITTTCTLYTQNVLHHFNSKSHLTRFYLDWSRRHQTVSQAARES